MFVKHRTLLFLFCTIIFSPSLHAEKKETKHTIHVLVDVSGSMKLNDPDNQRIEALRLLINLLPEGSQVGIWMFAQDTKLLSKTSSVDKKWKQQAIAASTKIHSRGLYTHIEDAILNALNHIPATDTPSNLILLTDGMVDISKDIMVSADSRERVLSELLPQLQQNKIRTHTIALSEHADKPLLNKLAFDTGGWAESPRNARELQKTFLNLFNKSVPQDTLPISGNSFKVDTSVKEFSLLIFKKDGSNPTILHTPDKKQLKKSSRSKKLSWINEKHYDLITLTSPKPGSWIIDADMDPDNQLMVLTDLKLQLEKTPQHLLQNESLDLNLHFTDQDKLITRGDFLQLLNIKLKHFTPDGNVNNLEMTGNGSPGHFTQSIKSPAIGRHKIEILADGKTFQREVIKTFDVVENFISAAASLDEKSGKILITLTANESLIEPGHFNGTATVDIEGQPTKNINLSPGDNALFLNVDRPEEGNSAIVNFDVMAKNHAGKPLSPHIKPIIIDDAFIKNLSIKKKSTPPNNEPPTKDEKTAEQEPVIPDDAGEEQINEALEEEEEDAEEGNWIAISIIVLLINLILIGGGFFGYKWLQKRNTSKQDELLERLI